jgi:hypothetical protein
LQHIALLVLWQRVSKLHGENMDDFLTAADRLVAALGLPKLSHFTTIEKFVLRVPSTLLEKVKSSGFGCAI